MGIRTSEAVRAMGATVIGQPPELIEYSIDTRSISPGSTYLALRGERFDGHAFLAQAKAAGAAAAIVSDTAQLPNDMPALVVADTQSAMLALAGTARTHFCGAVIAITGSAGKTTTKAFLAQLLMRARIGRIAATPQNENNEIGVSKVLLALGSEAAAVIEMGARNPGDIAPLVATAQPHIAILTNVGDAHVGIFGSRKALADTKWQLFSGTARAVLSLADACSRERYHELADTPLFCGLGDDVPVPDAPMLRYVDGRLRLQDPDRPERSAALTNLPPGEHNLRNLLAACGAAVLLGVPLETIARCADSFDMPKGRYERIPIPGGATIIHDAYNASPSGTLASLQAFAAEDGRRIVVLASMAELGDEAAAEHRRVGRGLAQVGASKILLGGEFADDLGAGALDGGVDPQTIERFHTNDEATRHLREILQSGDVVMVKGSRMYRLEQIIDALTATVEA